MLTISLNPETEVLEVKEVLHSATKTQTRYWYYDTRKWLKSSHGKLGDTPDRVMAEDDIQWVKRYYLPQVQRLAA